MAAEPLLRLRGVSKSFLGARGRRVDAVADVSLEVARGEVLVVAGESGSGKSTLARLVLGAEAADSGTVEFGGRDAARDIARVRRRCSMVQQDPYDSLSPRMAIGDIVTEPLEAHGIGGRAARRRRALEALAAVGLEPAAEIAARLPHELSGGQRQRVAIARALSTGPDMIVADEPVSMLDVSVRAGVLGTLAGLRASRGVAILYITHDLATARHFGDTLALMYRGRVVERGPVARVLASPRHPYTRALVDALPSPAWRPRAAAPAAGARGDGGGCAFRPMCAHAVPECARVPRLERRGGDWDVACFAPLDG